MSSVSSSSSSPNQISDKKLRSVPYFWISETRSMTLLTMGERWSRDMPRFNLSTFDSWFSVQGFSAVDFNTIVSFSGVSLHRVYRVHEKGDQGFWDKVYIVSISTWLMTMKSHQFCAAHHNVLFGHVFIWIGWRWVEWIGLVKRRGQDGNLVSS